MRLVTSSKADTLKNISGGGYTIDITGTGTCSAKYLESFKVFEPVPNSILASSIDATCNGLNDGYLVAAPAGTGLWSFKWKDVNGATIKTSNNMSEPDTLKNLSAGTYSVIVSFSNGCGNQSSKFTITEPVANNALFETTQVKCFGDSSGLLIATPNGTGPWYYTWKNQSGKIIQKKDSVFSSDSLLQIPAGNYSVKIAFPNKCGDITKNLSINQPNKVLASFTLKDDTLYTGSGSAIAQFQNSSSGAKTYDWNFGDASTSTLTNPAHTFTKPGVYSVTLIAVNGDCKHTFIMKITVLSVTGFMPDKSDGGISLLTNQDGSFIKLNFNETTSVLLNYFDVVGQLVKSESFSVMKETHKLKLPDTEGVFLMQVLAGNERAVFKVKQQKSEH